MSVSRQLTTAGALLLLAGVGLLAFLNAGNGYAEDPAGRASEAAPDAAGGSSTRARERREPPGAKELIGQRDQMVTRQIERPWDGRVSVKDKAVLAAMRAVPRHAFVPNSVQRLAYNDSPLPIGHGQTISQPYIVALMTELLNLTPESKVLEIGTGSGYQAAVLAHLTPHVYTVEIIEPLAERAKGTLAEQGYSEVKSRKGDGYFGWKDEAPFDGIIVTCAAGHLPPPLWEQLKPGGCIVIPIGGQYEIQRLVQITKTPEGERRSKTILSVRFVPLTRDLDAEGGGGRDGGKNP